MTRRCSSAFAVWSLEHRLSRSCNRVRAVSSRSVCRAQPERNAVNADAILPASSTRQPGNLQHSNLNHHQTGENHMQGNPRIIELLNGLISLEMRAINQYFLHSKMCENWGYERMAKRLRDQSFAEMKDAEELVDRVLYFDGLPNLQRFDGFMVGERVPEQLELALELENEAVAQISALMQACTDEGDTGTREFLAPKLLEEQTHISWIESQLTLVKQIGEANYLTQIGRAHV